MIYHDKFTITNRYRNIPAVPLICDGEIMDTSPIMVVVFDIFDSSIENDILYQLTKSIKRHDHTLVYDLIITNYNSNTSLCFVSKSGLRSKFLLRTVLKFAVHLYGRNLKTSVRVVGGKIENSCQKMTGRQYQVHTQYSPF